MLTEVITQERLKIFYAHACYLIKLESEFEAFKLNYNALKANNFNDVRVTSGSKKISPEEMYLLAMENKKKKIDKFTRFVNSERKIITEQIARLTNPVYQDILTDRYINLKDWKYTAFEYFGQNRDFWFYRETKYHSIVMTLHRRACEALEEISRHPYIAEDRQLTIGGY